jgi:hypothetical protein
MQSSVHQPNWVEKLVLQSLNRLPANVLATVTPGKIRKTLDQFFPEVVKALRKDYHTNSKGALQDHRREMRVFKRNLYQRWRRPLMLLESFIQYNLEVGKRIHERTPRKIRRDIKYHVGVKMHARACQVASEVYCLLEGGFAEGASARWRTLHELAVISEFLQNKPEIVYKKFLAYSDVETHFEALEYQKNHKALGYSRLTKKEMARLEESIQDLNKIYGPDFVRPYGWTADVLEPKKRNFAGIEETVSFNFMRSHYKLANHFVHGGSKALWFQLGTVYKNEIMLAGPSNSGFTDPAQNTAYSLGVVTSKLCLFESYIENGAIIALLKELITEIGKEFIAVQDQIDEEERQIRKGSKRNRKKKVSIERS